MKYAKFILMILLGIVMLNSSNAESKKEKKVVVKQNSEISVYYFHFTRRCITCNAVEKISKELIKEKYESKNVKFFEYNLDEDTSKEIANKLKVSGQTLLVVKGKKKIDLTQKAFMYAKNEPDKLKKILIETLNKLI